MAGAFKLCDLCLAAYQSLRFDPDAKPQQNVVPFGDIFWSDEHSFFPRWAPLQYHSGSMPSKNPCYCTLVNLVSARYSIWHGTPLTDELQSIWGSAQKSLPAWPGFRRVDYLKHVAAIKQHNHQLAAPVTAAHTQIVRSGADCPRCKLHHNDYRLIIPSKSLETPYIICCSCGCSSAAADFGHTPTVDLRTA